jgi:hypothetical protein
MSNLKIKRVQADLKKSVLIDRKQFDEFLVKQAFVSVFVDFISEGSYAYAQKFGGPGFIS